MVPDVLGQVGAGSTPRLLPMQRRRRLKCVRRRAKRYLLGPLLSLLKVAGGVLKFGRKRPAARFPSSVVGGGGGDKFAYYKARKMNHADEWMAWGSPQKLAGDWPITDPANPMYINFGRTEAEAVDRLHAEMGGIYGRMRWLRS